MIRAPDAANVLVQHTGEGKQGRLTQQVRTRPAHLELPDRHHRTTTLGAPSLLDMQRKSINAAGGGLSLSS